MRPRKYSTVTVGIPHPVRIGGLARSVRKPAFNVQPLMSCGKEVVEDHAYVVLQILHINRDMASAFTAWMSCAIVLLLHYCVLEISSIHRRKTGCLLSLREVWYSLPGPGRSQPVTSIMRARKVLQTCIVLYYDGVQGSWRGAMSNFPLFLCSLPCSTEC